MARKVQTVTIPAAEGNRDAGKIFVITEMAATRAEKWATRALLVLTRTGAVIPDEARSLGMAGIAIYGLRALSGLTMDDAEPLLDEMLTCVQVQPDPRQPMVVRPLLEDDTEEVSTLLLLRREVFELHTGFSMAGILSKMTDPAETEGNSSLPPTSPPISPQS